MRKRSIDESHFAISSNSGDDYPISPRSLAGEHRSKRVKHEHKARGEDPQDTTEPEPVAQMMDAKSDGDSEPGFDIEALAVEAARVAMANARSHIHQNYDVTAESSLAAEHSQNGGMNGDDRVHHDTAMPSAPDVDFSSAPSDPVELALWVARQISNFQQNGSDSTEDTERSRISTHPPALITRRLYDDDDPAKAAERERQREENRERKKRWRESNSERSMGTCETVHV